MKRLIKRFAVFLIPFAVVFALFLAFDAYDYFGLGSHKTYLSKPLSTTRELVRDRSENIILGDSHMANCNVDYIESISGERYTMLAYGGATLPENIDQFWYAAEHTDLKKVVFGVEFYNMNPDNYTDRFTSVIEKVENPIAFLRDYTYWIEAVDNMFAIIQNGLVKLTGIEALGVYVDDPSSLEMDIKPPTERNYMTGARIDLENYCLVIYRRCESYSAPVEYLEELGRIIDYCDENGIEIVFVLPPANAEIWNRVIYPLGIDKYIEQYKDFLKSRATVYDFEFYNDFARNDDNFLDGMHLVLRGKLWLTDVVFGGEESPYCIKTTKDEYLAGGGAAGSDS